MIEIRPANAPVSSKKAKAPTETRPLGASGIEIRPKSENPYYAEQRPIADLAPSTPPVAPSPEMGLGDVAMEGAKGLARGGLGLAQSIGGAGVEMAGQLGAGAYDLLRTPQNFPGMTPGQLTEVEAARAALVPTQNPLEDQGQFAKQVFPAGSPIIAADPRASAENAPYLTTSPGIPQLARLAGEAGEMAPNAAATIGAAVATGGLGPAGALAGGAMGGGLEGLSEYQQVLDKGGSPVEALRAAAVMGAGAGALNAIPFVTYSTKFLPPSMRGTAARAMLSFIAEGSTETAEGGVSAIARMKSLPKSQEEWAEAYSKVERGIIDESNVFLVAGLMGGGTAIAAGGEPTIPSAGPVGVTIGPDSASPVDKLEPGRNAPLPEPERFEEDYAPFDLPAQEQAPTAPSTPQQSEAIPEPIQAPDNAVAPSPEAVVAPEPEPELSESEKQAEADLLAEFPELKGMLDAARRSGPLNDDLVNTILNADTVDSREIPKIEVRKPVSREESLSKLIEERPALDVGRPLDAAVRPEEEGVPQGPARVTVRAQDRPRPGERPTSAVPSPEVRATVRGPEPVASEEPAPTPAAEFVGLQERPRGQAPIALYNIPTPDGGKTTVTAETAKSQGFSVPEPPVTERGLSTETANAEVVGGTPNKKSIEYLQREVKDFEQRLQGDDLSDHQRGLFENSLAEYKERLANAEKGNPPVVDFENKEAYEQLKHLDSVIDKHLPYGNAATGKSNVRGYVYDKLGVNMYFQEDPKTPLSPEQEFDRDLRRLGAINDTDYSRPGERVLEELLSDEAASELGLKIFFHDKIKAGKDPEAMLGPISGLTKEQKLAEGEKAKEKARVALRGIYEDLTGTKLADAEEIPATQASLPTTPPQEPAQAQTPVRATEIATEPEVAQKQPWEMTREEYDSDKPPLKPRQSIVLDNYGKKTEVVQNPTNEDIARLSDAVRKKFPDMPKGEVKLRQTRDEDGNEYVWQAHEGMHGDIEPALQEIVGAALNQNADKKPHRNVVYDALLNGKTIPEEVLSQYPEVVDAYNASKKKQQPAPEAKPEAPKAAAGGDAVAKALQRELDRRTEENISLKQKIKDVKSGKIGPYSVLSAPKATKAGAVRELERRISVNNEPIDKYEERRVVDLDIESSMDLGEDIDAGLLDYFSNVDSPASTGPRGEKSPRADSPRKQRVDMLSRRGYSLVGDVYTKALPPAVQQADARIPKSKKGKADDESGYVNMSLFNPMEALRILRGKLKDGKFIEFEQGFMGLKDLKVARSGKIKSLQMRGKLIAQDFENAWRKEWQKQNPGVKAKTVRFRDMPAETVEALNDYLAEEDAGVKAQLLSELPEGLRRPATQMRDLVDQMSQELIDMGIVEDDVQKVIADQMGFYLRRTYAIFQDPKYRDNIPKAVEDNARKWLREKFPTYTTNQIESALADLKGVGSEKEALNRLVQMGGVLGKLDRRTLGKRNEYDQAILDLWGVDKNGIDNFLNTINAQAHMIANFEWLEDIKANGRGSVVLTPQDIAALPQGDERAQWPFLNESDSRKSVSMSTRPKDPAASRNKALDKFIAKAESQGDAGTVEVLKKTKALFEKGMKLEDGKEVVDSRNLEGASKYAEQLQAEADKFQAEGVAAPRGKKGPLKAKSRVAQSKANKINRQIKAILEAEEQKANAEPDTFGPFGPLAGARVHPEFKAALQEAVQIQEVAPWIQKWNWFNRQLKQNVTTRDPASALRNFRSGVDFSMANGWMLYDAKNVPKRLTKALSIANVDIRRSHDPALREEYLKMVEYGIAGDTAIVGELNEIQKEAKKAEFVKAAEKALSPELVKAMGGADALATKLYQAGDDAFKIFGALTEQEHLMEATGMDSDAALKEGAARVRRQFPTYSELHKMLQKFRRTPFIGPFVAYQSEVPRNAWNTIAQMATEIKSKNPKVRAMGYRRAVGIMWATVNRHAYKAAWMILLGLTYDDDERIGKALPEWYQGHEFAFTKGDRATGKYLGYNLSQADAYGPLKESFWAAMRGDNILDAAGDALMAFGGGYVAPQLGTQAVVDAYTGNDARGNSLYMKTDTVGEKAGKTLLHAVEALTPSPARRQAKAETVEEHVREVFGTLTGYRFIEIDLPTDLFWKAKDFKKYGTEQVRDAYAAARDGNTEAAKKQLKDLEAVRQDYFDELREAYLAFKATRISIDLLDAKLKEADLSAKEIEAVKYGTLEPYTPPQKLTDMME